MSVIRIVMKLCRPYWLLLTAFLLCLIVESVYGALSPLSFKFLIDDAFEPTSEAVARLQTQARLEPSGIIDPRTASVMVELLKVKLKDNNTQMNKAIEVLLEFIHPS